MLEVFSRLAPDWFHRAFVYTGSVGPFDNDFRFRLAQDAENQRIHAAAYSRVAYELAEDKEERDFPWDEPGVEGLKAWLQERYEAYAAAHGLPLEGPGPLPDSKEAVR